MKTVIITGGNSGLGFETAKKVARDRNFRVILACRNAEKAEKAKEEIVRETGNDNVVFRLLDTSSLASVRTFADQVLAEAAETDVFDADGDAPAPVDILVNNAGIGGSAAPGTTEDGFERTFATNYLGHFLLTQLLLPVMPEDGRIYNVSSDMHNPPGGLTWNGVEPLAHPAGDPEPSRYAYTKLCMVYHMHELHRRLRAEGRSIKVNCFNPGFMSDTNFTGGRGKEMEPRIRLTMPERIGSLSASSDALAQLITDDTEFAYISNGFFDRSTRCIFTSALSYNEANEKELWEASMKYTGLA